MAEKDIAPELIEKVNKDFEENLSKDKKAAGLKEKLSQGSADYADAYEYAESVGTARAKAFGEQISSEVLPDGRMYYNIASRLMEETLTADHNMVSEFASGVQKTYNEKAGIGLKALRADLDEDRIDGFVQRLASEEDYDEVSWLLDEPVVTHARSVVDDTIKKNAEFQHKSGIKATVTRRAAPRCCDWCTDLEGDYTYPSVPREVFQRHDHCKCTVDYEGRRLTAYEGKKGSHSFRDQGEQERIEERRKLAEEGRKDKKVVEKERLLTSYRNAVQMNALDAPGFVEKFQGITGIEEVDNSIYEYAVEILKHRTGTNFEDLYLINANTGEIIHKLTTCNIPNGVDYDEETKKAIADAHKAGINLLAIHNHPGGLPPTLDDGVSAFNNTYTCGVAIGHNLEVYVYGPANQNYTEEQCKELHEMITDAVRFSVDFEDDIWYNALKAHGMEASRR